MYTKTLLAWALSLYFLDLSTQDLADSIEQVHAASLQAEIASEEAKILETRVADLQESTEHFNQTVDQLLANLKNLEKEAQK